LFVILITRESAPAEPLVVFCAAGLAEPIEASRAAYEAEHGASVTVRYGGSGGLLSRLRAGEPADVYIPADRSYLGMDAVGRPMVLGESLPLAEMPLVLAVPAGNPHQIASLADLTTKDVRLSLADPETSASGKLVRDALRTSGQWESLRARVTSFHPSVSEVAADLKAGVADAGIVWQPMLQQLPGFKTVAIEEFAGLRGEAAAAPVLSTRRLRQANQLMFFLGTSPTARRQFEQAGFIPLTRTSKSPAP